MWLVVNFQAHLVGIHDPVREAQFLGNVLKIHQTGKIPEKKEESREESDQDPGFIANQEHQQCNTQYQYEHDQYAKGGPRHGWLKYGAAARADKAGGSKKRVSPQSALAHRATLRHQ
jgi:hypothetical protein